VSGGTSTGKTTMTNAFVRHIPAHERIVVIEKPVEMKLDHRNSPRLEAYPRVGDRPEVTVSQLLSLTLRHRPDRIIVGEVKDSEAAYGLLQAMNTGHDGTLSTIHSNTAGVRLEPAGQLGDARLRQFGSFTAGDGRRHRHSRRSETRSRRMARSLIVFWKSAATTIAAGQF